MSVFDAFLSYNRRDSDAVARVAEQLRAAGLAVFLDKWYLTPGNSWINELEQKLGQSKCLCVFIGPHGLGNWQQREKNLGLDRQAAKSAYRVIPVILPGNSDPSLGFLSLNTWIDLRKNLDDVAPLVHAIRGEALAETTPDPRALICPYRGLHPFREEDAAFFFGRETFTQQLIEEVHKDNWLAVVGASGSGKSSVVRAGLLPALRKSPKDEVWEILTMVPNDRPLRSLATQFVTTLEPQLTTTDRLLEINKVVDSLEKGSVALRDYVDTLLEKQPGTTRLLLVIDQWEEVYTLCQDPAQRKAFIDLLLEATLQPTLHVAITLRGDFFGRVLAHRPLADRLQGRIANLGPMTPEELEAAVLKPAAAVNLRFEEGLPERILTDVGGEPGNLPLLEFALLNLWEQKKNGILLNSAYTDMDGVQSAMAQRAEQLFMDMESQQDTLRRVFTRLVKPGEGAADTRRRASLNELQGVIHPLIKKLADERLLVTNRDEEADTETVEVSHEALIRG
ncbi:MAG: toll/interleukin-1 receptor domain-containing protein, partial [Bacteroidota bacterium]